ncbi:MAG: acyltransferase family protein, partial [Armatimonadota bacterium]|nr:acyltransferase family protein [Armatimonadota bacterium]
MKNIPWWNEPTLGERSATRTNNFDFLRFFFASVVVFSHSYLLTGRQDEPFARLTHGQINGGAAAVVFFFIISGFLITGSWVQSGRLGSFVRKRVLRIYPGFIVAVRFSLGAGAVGAASIRKY